MERVRFTLIGFALAFLVLISSWIFGLDLFERMVEVLYSFEKYDIDEFFIPLFIFILFAYADQARMKKNQALEIEKVKIYKAMLHSSHHILNNFLNQMQLFRIKAEANPGFDPKILSLYEKISNEASELIEALGSVAKIDEQAIIDSIKPKPIYQSVAQQGATDGAEKSKKSSR